jgi:nitroimidazol reductase NimA-like FMN-containing flavoprotein (pyridoxamine 5'-phosphate oxidase superfamily)
MPHRSPTTLDRAACLELMATRSLGRLVYTHRALPDVLPVNYRLDGENVLIRLTIGSTAALATRASVVAFEADDFDPRSLTGWSVTIVGLAREITDADELHSLAVTDLSSWGADGHDLFLSVAAEKVTGRRLVAALQGSELQVDTDVDRLAVSAPENRS